MKDIAVRFNGVPDTVFDFGRMVEGKAAEEQRYIINMATGAGTDRIYPDRGTDLLADTSGSVVFDENGAAHIGNFAALDTTLFMEQVSTEERMASNDAIYVTSVTPVSYSNEKRILHLAVKFVFNDESETSLDLNLES